MDDVIALMFDILDLVTFIRQLVEILHELVESKSARENVLGLLL